jgi:mutual gliding-motility protein MglA
MPVIQHGARELHLKIVYYGPGLGGKTTNLRNIHARTRPDLRGRMVSIDNEAERTLMFDLLPVFLGVFRGYDIRLHLCTVPGQFAHGPTRRLVLRHVDGVVFVVDSQRAAFETNLQSIRDLEDNLRMQGDDPNVLPLVVQYNKRDLPDLMPVDELRARLLVPPGVPEIEAQAVHGVGVFETLRRVVTDCLALVKDPGAMPEGRSPSVLPGARASMHPGGRPPAVDARASSRGEREGSRGDAPPPPRVPTIDEE